MCFGDWTGTAFSTLTGNFASNITAGSVVWVGLDNEVLSGTPNVTDGPGDTFTAGFDSVTDSHAQNGVQFYAKNSAGGSKGVSFTSTGGTSSFIIMGCIEFSGRDTAAPLSGHNIRAQTSPGTTTDSARTNTFATTAGDDVAGMYGDSPAAQTTITAGTGFTLGATMTSGGIVGAVEYSNNVSANASFFSSFTLSVNDDGLLYGCAFKASGGAATGKNPLPQTVISC